MIDIVRIQDRLNYLENAFSNAEEYGDCDKSQIDELFSLLRESLEIVEGSMMEIKVLEKGLETQRNHSNRLHKQNQKLIEDVEMQKSFVRRLGVSNRGYQELIASLENEIERLELNEKAAHHMIQELQCGER